jgi:hypothetical protein
MGAVFGDEHKASLVCDTYVGKILLLEDKDHSFELVQKCKCGILVSAHGFNEFDDFTFCIQYDARGTENGSGALIGVLRFDENGLRNP